MKSSVKEDAPPLTEEDLAALHAPAVPREPLLRARGVTLQYNTPEYMLTATYRVSFDIGRGDRLVLLGPSGCGKSTLLKAIGGHIHPAEGEILLDGKVITRPGIDRGMVFQEFDQLLPWKTALENIVFAIRNTRRTTKAEAVNEAQVLLKKINLGGFEHSYPHSLSGGMKQRVAIARCLAVHSAIILMDEPFASLDALTRRKMQEDLLALWSESRFTMLFVTHSIEEALILGSRVIILSPRPGRVTAEFDIDITAHNELDNPALIRLRERISRILLGDAPEYSI
ncbi:MAG: ABC transporter ATP-binding protein [Deltaproteobacteria bacterium]|jgi:NitT/TauT family transport system ATP-binding protein|nr:ABC transporter ATP-binding protein [Deltaproteobacteria bacterium]